MTVIEGPACTGTARALHWITAIGVLTMIPAGILMIQIKGGDLQNFVFDYHRSMGVLLFVITAVRLAYRLGNGRCPRLCTSPFMDCSCSIPTRVGPGHRLSPRRSLCFGCLNCLPLSARTGPCRKNCWKSKPGRVWLPPLWSACIWLRPSTIMWRSRIASRCA